MKEANIFRKEAMASLQKILPVNMINTVGTQIPPKGKCMEHLGMLIKKGNHIKAIEAIPSVPTYKIDDPDKTCYRVAYEHLHLVLEIVGIKGVVEMYHISGFNIQAPEKEQQLYEKCKNFTDAELAKITAMILEGGLCDIWWADTDNPSSKIRRLAEKKAIDPLHRFRTIQCGEFTDEIKRVAKHKFNAVNLDAIPAAAVFFDVSLRWLLTLDPSVTLYYDRLAFEDFYDAYMLLPAQRRAVIDAMLEGRGKDA